MAQEVKYLSYSGLSHFKDRVFEVINPLISENKANILSIQNFLENPVFEEVNTNTLNVISEINLNGTRLFNFDFLPISGGTLTGDLSFNMANVDRFINFNYNGGTTYSWRLGYLGSGSGDANYFTIQSAKAASTQWYPVVNFGNETLNANFAGDILPMTSNTKNLGSSSLKWANVYATTLYENGTSLANKYATKHTHTELTDDEIDTIFSDLGVTF